MYRASKPGLTKGRNNKKVFVRTIHVEIADLIAVTYSGRVFRFLHDLNKITKLNG